MNENNSVDNLLKEGTLHLERSHYHKALEIFQKADETDPSNPEIKNALGLTYFRQTQYQKSIEYLDLALQLKPDYLSALVRRGMAYKYLGQTELGHLDYEAVLQAEPQTYGDWRARGIAYDELKQPESAFKCYDKALEIKPDDYLSLFNKGLTLQNLKQYELALQCYGLSLNIFPDRFFTISNIAYTLFALQRYEEALDAYNQAIELKPDDYVSYSWRGATLGNLEQYQEAILSFNTALEINPNWNFAYVKRFYIREYIKSIESKNLYKQFLSKALFAINNLSDDSLTNKILEKNSNLLDSQLSEVLEGWANTIAENLDIVIQKLIAYDIWDLCNYIRDFEFGDQSEIIEIVIATRNIISTILDKEHYYADWAMNQYNIGLIYKKRIQGNLKDNVEASINHYRNALLERLKTERPKKWASIQDSLGYIYTERIAGKKKDNLETAIDCYHAALTVYTETDYPQDWASTISNLGFVYRERLKGEQKDNLEAAIDCFITALRIYTESDYPEDWALNLLALAETHIGRVEGERKNNLETAINLCDKALRVLTRKDYPKNWALTYFAAGNAHIFRIEGEQKENLETAIGCFNLALEIFDKENNKHLWAITYSNLSVAFLYRIEGDKEDNLETAIKCCNAALEVVTKENNPQDWANIQHNFAYIYSERIVENRNQNIERAIKHYKNALKINTPQTNPFQCLNTAKFLGSLAFTQGNWELAIETYSIAIEAIETSRLISTDDARRQEIISDAISVYDNIVQALINQGQIEKAIEYAERSRCRRLVDLMATNDLYSDGNIPPKVAEYLQEYEALQKSIDAERNRSSNNTNNGSNIKGVAVTATSPSLTRATYNAVNDEIEKLETEKEKVWQKIRSLDPILSEQIQVAPIPFDDICQLIPDSKTALVSHYITANQIQTFIIYKDQTVRLHTAEVKFQELRNFAVDSWIVPYLDEFNLWKKQIPQNIAILAKKLNLSELVRNYLQDIEELIIIPHLYLHLVPFAALPISPSENLDKTDSSEKAWENHSLELLGDRFRIRTLPSAQILQFCHQRDSKAIPTVDYGMVEDADNSLPCSQYEGEQIAQIFNVPEDNRLRGEGENQATVAKYRELVGRVQVLHSSHHAASRLDNPLESCLKLADGTISLGSIMSPGWRLPNLRDVFLSCCETNLGRTEMSDDPLTIATGFLCAGARSVVSTLWEVDDLATSIFSIIYYQLRKEGLDRPTALQHAQYKLRTMSGDQLKAKYDSTLGKHLRTQHSSIRQKKKEIRSELNNFEPETDVSIEYKEFKREFRQLKHQDELFSKQIRRFRSLTRKSLPFAHPFYWAGFISQGLR